MLDDLITIQAGLATLESFADCSEAPAIEFFFLFEAGIKPIVAGNLVATLQKCSQGKQHSACQALVAAPRHYTDSAVVKRVLTNMESTQ